MPSSKLWISILKVLSDYFISKSENATYNLNRIIFYLVFCIDSSSIISSESTSELISSEELSSEISSEEISSDNPTSEESSSSNVNVNLNTIYGGYYASISSWTDGEDLKNQLQLAYEGNASLIDDKLAKI